MKSNDFLSEDIASDAHEMHLDHEVQMARKDCYTAADNAIALHKLLRNVSEQQGLEGWVAAKITLASDYLNTVREHLEYQLMSQVQPAAMELPVAEGYRDRRDAYQRDQDNAEYGMNKYQSRAYSADGGANDERHDLDPTDWYVVKDGKLFAISVYPRQEQEAMALGYSRTKQEARAKASTQGVAEADELRARGGIEAVNKKPRPGQTDFRDIPVGNYPGSRRKFSDKDREEQPKRLKSAIKATLGKHTRPNLPEQGVAEGSDSSASATPAKNERGRFTALDDDEPIRLKCEDGKFRTIQEINMLRQKIGMKPFSIKSQQGVAEGAGNIGQKIKALYKKIYDQGDDSIDYMYHESPIFAQYWDEYEGDLDSIVAEVDPSELQIIHDELEAYLQGPGLAENTNSPAYQRVELYNQGRKAGLSGQGTNPYGDPDDSREAYFWQEGYEDGQTLKSKGVAEGKHPETWHDVDKKLGRQVDKMSQAEKVKKGLAHPDTLKKSKEQKVSETSAGSVAGVVNPTPKNKAKVGTLFGGTYKQKKTKA